MSKPLLAFCLATFATLLASGCEDSQRTGNQLICQSGNCSSSCNDVDTSEPCGVQCEAGSSCDATCNAGQTCNFMCLGDARCQFDCTGSGCQASGGPSCSCTGDCLGTCGGPAMMMGDDAGTDDDAGTGGSCIDMCGEPTDPGYVACVTACG